MPTTPVPRVWPKAQGGAAPAPTPPDYSSPDLSDTIVLAFFGEGFEVAKSANDFPLMTSSSTF